jgi:N-methylhydantoinase B
MVEVKYCVESAVMGALAQAIKGKVTGDLKGGGNHAYLGGVDPQTGEPYVFYEYPAAGNGAWDGGDGNNAVRAFTESDMTTLQPVEAVEQKYPLRVERTALRENSGGDGRWRGGLGLSRELTLLGPEARFSVLSEKNILPPYGVCGGMAGAPNRFFIIRDGLEVEPSPLPGKVSGFPVRVGDLVLLQSSGGGGYGDPLERDPEAVARDVAEGVVSVEKAERVYGVILAGGRVDQEATRRQRLEIGAGRPRVRLRELSGPPAPDGRRTCRLSAGAAERLGLGEGDIAEFVNPMGAPLRAWIEGVVEDGGDLAWLARDACALLAADDEAVEVRSAASRRAPAGRGKTWRSR